LTIALVDNDPECLYEMERLCHDFGKRCRCPIETFLFTSGEAFLEALKKNRFSVVFMDIYMEGMDGVRAALKMREQDNRCFLVFLTSSTDFMPDAFSCHAFEYIVKPFTPERISEVLTDVLKVFPTSQKYMEVVSGRKSVPILFDDIVSAVTDAHYLDIFLADGTRLRCRMTMPEFIVKAENDARFISVNKGILVNADYILDFEGNACLLDNGLRLPLRVRDRLRIEQAVHDYHFSKMRSQQAYFTK